MKKRILLILITISTLGVACFDDLDDNIQTSSNSAIGDFIYRGLNYFYLYKSATPELADDYFTDQNELNSFLDSFENPRETFDFLIAPTDRFSVLVNDYNDIENALNGITLNNGMEFGLVYYTNGSTNLFGYVRYVLQNTDAAAKGIQRGMLFNTINGQQLTYKNYLSLISLDSYEIGLATLNDETIVPSG